MEGTFSLYYELLYFTHRLHLGEDNEMNVAHVLQL